MSAEWIEAASATQGPIPLWLTLLVAAIGSLIGGLLTLAGVLFSQRAAKDREDIRWGRERDLEAVRYERDQIDRLREIRVKLYVDATEFAQHQESYFFRVTDPDASPTETPTLTHPDLLTARLRLYAHPPMLRAWDGLLRALAAIQSIYDLGTFQTDPADDKAWIREDEPAVLCGRVAVQAVIISMRTHLGEDEHDIEFADVLTDVLTEHISTLIGPGSGNGGDPPASAKQLQRALTLLEGHELNASRILLEGLDPNADDPGPSYG